MQTRKPYRKRPKFDVTAVQLDLKFDHFKHEKWGGIQSCKPGDWLVNNNGDIYTIDKEFFRDNYQRVSAGVYRKVGNVWAEVAETSGAIATREGSTEYTPGDYLVFEGEQGGDGYAVKKQLFERMYEAIDPQLSLTPEQQAYIDQRIAPKIAEFKEKAKRNRVLYYIWQTVAIITAALVPVFSGFIEGGQDGFKWVVAIFGGASAVVAGLLSLFKFQENWQRFRTTHQDLDSHLTQFNIGIGIYSERANAFPLLAENCENILKAEVGQWAESRTREKGSDNEGV